MYRIAPRTQYVPQVLRTCFCRFMSSTPDGGDGEDPKDVFNKLKEMQKNTIQAKDGSDGDKQETPATEKPNDTLESIFQRDKQDIEAPALELPKGGFAPLSPARPWKLSPEKTKTSILQENIQSQGGGWFGRQKQSGIKKPPELVNLFERIKRERQSEAEGSVGVVSNAIEREIFRTKHNDPREHTAKQDGLFYRVPTEDWSRWMTEGLLPDFYKAVKAFNENCLMVRSPAVEIMECMRAANYDYPTIRYLLYGRVGAGKSTTMAHLMHFCGKHDWVILHVPWAAHIHRYAKDIIPSTHTKGLLDQPTESAKWLNYFLNMNKPLLVSQQVKTVGRYVYSRREIIEEGTPLLEMIDFGLQRTKYACDVMGAVIKEMKMQASSRNFKVLFAIDGVNAIYEQTTYITETSRHKFYQAQELAMVQHIMKLLRSDWNGGAVVCTVDKNASHAQWQNHTSYMPRFLLGEEGFELLDPFIPVHIPDYSDKEAESCIGYFVDRRWIQNPAGFSPEGRKEIKFLSSNNPLELYNVTRRW